MRKPARERLRELYEGRSALSRRWRWTLLGADIALILFFVASTFVEHGPWLVRVDYAIGAVLLVEWMARLWAARDRLAYLAQPISIVDAAVILSLFAPAVTENFVFLRILRALRFLRTYHVLRELRTSSSWFRTHEQAVFAGANLGVFIFTVSALVYALQHRVNPEIKNYIDALYFTATTLTTTGFGDVTLVGEWGRLLAVVIMFVGVTLFLRLIQALFRPLRVDYDCPDCGLSRHDPDAVHCKHCGRLLNIPTTGETH